MKNPLPRTILRPLRFANGCAIDINNRWHKGQYCVILSAARLVGCGIYDMKRADEFGQAIAITCGTADKPLVDPEDQFEANIVDLTSRSR